MITNLLWLIPICIVAYFIGNINFSILLSKRRKKDIRALGSGNPGATNMLRTFGFKMALVTLFLDAFKAAAPVFAAYALFGGLGSNANASNAGVNAQIALYAVGFSVVIGHCYPVLYRFKGGKGVACMVGVFFVADPLVAFIAIVSATLFILVVEYGAIASFLFMSIVTIRQSLLSESLTVSLLIFALYLLAWFMHRKNIFRLLTGEESKASILKKIKRRNLVKRQKLWLEEQ